MQDKRNFFWLNGEMVRSDQPALTINNRLFAFGDGFYELIHAYGTEGKHLALHLERIVSVMQILSMSPPPYLSLQFLSDEIRRLLNKNRIFGSASIRVTVFRQTGELSAPDTDPVSIAIQAEALEADYYPYNQRGLVVDLFSDIRKPISPLSTIGGSNSLLNVLAAKYAKQMQVDECILINDQNRVVECISSNLFAVKGNVLLTPPLDEGCTGGVMRSIVLQLATKVGLKPIDNRPIEVDDLLKMDELFIANAIEGVQWIVGLRLKRYFGSVSQKISAELYRQTFSL